MRKLVTFLLLHSFVFVVVAAVAAANSTEFDATRRLALHEDPVAQNELGSMYAKGQGVSQDYSQALIWYRKAAELGNPEGQYNLGRMFHHGMGTGQDLTQAVKWYGTAADQGNADAKKGLEEIKNYIDSLRSSADHDKPEALLGLGDLYAQGNGVAQDAEQAVVLYRRAAEQGSPAGQCRLGDMYADGRGVKQNFPEAVRLYRQAIGQDYAEAKYKLATMYHRGRGVPKDDVYAYALIRLAAAQGDTIAIANEKFAASLLTSQQREKALKLADQLRAESAPRPR